MLKKFISLVIFTNHLVIIQPHAQDKVNVKVIADIKGYDEIKFFEANLANVVNSLGDHLDLEFYAYDSTILHIENARTADGDAAVHQMCALNELNNSSTLIRGLYLFCEYRSTLKAVEPCLHNANIKPENVRTCAESKTGEELAKKAKHYLKKVKITPSVIIGDVILVAPTSTYLTKYLCSKWEFADCKEKIKNHLKDMSLPQSTLRSLDTDQIHL